MIQGAKIVHHIPGRLRVRLSRTQRNPHLLDQLRGFVESLEGVHSVEMNPVTGSIVVYYHPESRDDIQNLLRSRAAWFESPPGLTESDQLAEQIEKEAEFLAAHSELALHMVRSFRGLNDEIRRRTDNLVDLKVLLPAGLAVWAFLKAGVEVSTPLWVTLAIFSFNSFVALHHPATVRVSTHATEVESRP